MSLAAQELVRSSRRTVLDRILMWDKGIVQIEVPLEAKPGSIRTDEGLIIFWQFPKMVPDKSKPGGTGTINFFVHTTDGKFDHCPGTKIIAQMQIWRKNLGNRSYLFVDLRPSPEGAAPTHQLVGVMEQQGHRRKSIPFLKEECEFFETPAPLFGVVVVAPIDAIRHEMVVEPRSNTGYPALDRKLADGWIIDDEDDKVVNLYKFDGVGNKRIDKFHKPQPKIKKK